MIIYSNYRLLKCVQNRMKEYRSHTQEISKKFKSP